MRNLQLESACAPMWVTLGVYSFTSMQLGCGVSMQFEGEVSFAGQLCRDHWLFFDIALLLSWDLLLP